LPSLYGLFRYTIKNVQYQISSEHDEVISNNALPYILGRDFPEEDFQAKDFQVEKYQAEDCQAEDCQAEDCQAENFTGDLQEYKRKPARTEAGGVVVKRDSGKKYYQLKK
jgi:hypothetical protein